MKLRKNEDGNFVKLDEAKNIDAMIEEILKKTFKMVVGGNDSYVLSKDKFKVEKKGTFSLNIIGKNGMTSIILKDIVGIDYDKGQGQYEIKVKGNVAFLLS